MKKQCFYCLGKMKKGVCPSCGSNKCKETIIKANPQNEDNYGNPIIRINKLTGRYSIYMGRKYFYKDKYLDRYLHPDGVILSWGYEYFTLWGARRSLKRYKLRKEIAISWVDA